jgi:hypothetical protein
MNKTDISALKKALNTSKGTAEILKIYSVYIKYDNQSEVSAEIDGTKSENIIGAKEIQYHLLDENVRDVLIDNMKKVISGSIGTKVFKQKFKEETEYKEYNTKDILNNIIRCQNDDFSKLCDIFINKIEKNIYCFESDIVVNFYKAKLTIKSDAMPFIFATVNKVTQGKEAVTYDYVNQEFELQNGISSIVNMQSPEAGFVYPVYEDMTVDYEYIIESNSDSGNAFSENVLQVKRCLTSKEEKESFNMILNDVVGEKIEPEKLQNVYEAIQERFAETEDKIVTPTNIENVLKDADIEIKEDVKEKCEEILNNPSYKFNVENILPKMSEKSIMLKNEDIEIKVKPEGLGNVKQFQTNNGKLYALIELDENLNINGINAHIENIEEIQNILK